MSRNERRAKIVADAAEVYQKQDENFSPNLRGWLSGIRGILPIARLSFLRQNLAVILVFCAGILVSLALFSLANGWEQEQTRGQFADYASLLASRLEASIAADMEVIASIGGLFAASDSVERHEFKIFVAGALSRHPDIQALEWIPYVPDSQRTLYGEAAQAEGFPSFQFVEKDSSGKLVAAAQRDVYFPVYYAEPLAGNEVALGFDLASNPQRLAALERARDTGSMLATARLRLVQETGEQFGFLVFQPIYLSGAPQDTVEERRASLQGFALGAFRIGDLVRQSIGKLDDSPYAVRLYDEGAPAGLQLLYESGQFASGEAHDQEDRSEFSEFFTFDVGGRKWSLQIHSTSTYGQGKPISLPSFVLIAGLALTFMVTAYLRMALRRASELLRVNTEIKCEIWERNRAAEALRESEERYRTLVETSPDIIAMADLEGKLLFCNHWAVRQFGWDSAEELIGRSAFDLITPEDLPRAVENLRRTLEVGAVRQVEYKLLKKDGGCVPVELSASLIADAEGNSRGFMAVMRDITERRQAQQELEESFRRLQRALEGTVHAIALVLEQRDPYTAGHQQRVARLACAIAEEMGLAEEQIRAIDLASSIHDIGKISAPAEILSKPSRLTAIEYSMVKVHCQIGYDILKTIEFPWPIAEIVYQHHERLDGSGYPSGLSGAEILLEARVIAVADVVEAMASHRPYRPALGIDKALEEISTKRDVLYDPFVVDACVKVFENGIFKFD